MNKNKKMKAKYGWYAGNFITGFGIIGLSGLLLIFVGLIFSFPFTRVFFIAGLILSILFTWPAMGMIAMNLQIFSAKPDYSYLMQFNAPRVLDCGCGTGRNAIALAKALPPGGHLSGIDIYNSIITGNSLETVERNASIEKVDTISDFRHGSITDIPFDDNSFDIISVQSVLHEIHNSRDLNRALSEVKRVLKNNGLLIIGEWHSMTPRLILYTGFLIFMMATVVFKTKYFWRKIIQKAGMDIVKETDNGGFNIFNCKISRRSMKL